MKVCSVVQTEILGNSLVEFCQASGKVPNNTVHFCNKNLGCLVYGLKKDVYIKKKKKTRKCISKNRIPINFINTKKLNHCTLNLWHACRLKCHLTEHSCEAVPAIYQTYKDKTLPSFSTFCLNSTPPPQTNKNFDHIDSLLKICQIWFWESS